MCDIGCIAIENKSQPCVPHKQKKQPNDKRVVGLPFMEPLIGALDFTPAYIVRR